MTRLPGAPGPHHPTEHGPPGRSALQPDAAALGRLIGEAFVDDPVSLWAMGTPAAVIQTYSTLVRHVYLPRGLCTLEDGVGATLWLPPGADKRLPFAASLALGLSLSLQAPGRHLWRTWHLDQALRRKRPTSAHMYLFAIGVRRSERGRGRGGLLLSRSLAQCDALQLPVFLENTHPSNRNFYQKHNFEITETYSPIKGCPPLDAMWRPPRPIG